MIIPIKDFSGYFISNTGEIYSDKPRPNSKKPRERHKLSQWINSWGYKCVTLFNDKNYNIPVHLLMLRCFVGEAPKGFHCRHLDNNKLNNHIDNLKWGTRSENQKDRLLNNTSNRGSRHGMSKLKEINVLQIRALKRSTTMSNKDIAKMFDVSETTIIHIIKGETWSWL